MNAIVTGASRGIGFNTVINLCKNGVDKIYAISRSKNELDKLKAACAQFSISTEVIPLVYDLTTILSDNEDLLSHISSSSIDILVNNAGVLVNKPFEHFSLEESKIVFDVNFHAPAKLIQYLLPKLKNSNNAHVVNISSIGGFQGSSKFPGLSYYSASKAAISALTECLAEEYKEEKIKFNCLAFGAVQTEMLAEAFPGYVAPITAEEMGIYVADFALNGHKYFNGQVLPVRLSNP